jgi:hypothetical protein
VLFVIVGFLGGVLWRGGRVGEGGEGEGKMML